MPIELVPPFATVSVNVVPTGKVRAVALGSEKLNSCGVAELGGETLLLTVVLKPLLAVSVSVTLREPGVLLPRRSHRRTGIAPDAMENEVRSGGVMVKVSVPFAATVSMTSVALVGTVRDRNVEPVSRR